MKIAVTGASGFVGNALVKHFVAQGHEMIKISRSPSLGDVVWDVAAKTLDRASLEGCDVLIHLAGENVGKRWTSRVRKQLWTSRIDSTVLLINAMAQMQRPPRVMLAASAIGYYGYATMQRVDESSPKGKGYLAELCQAWEAAAKPVEALGVRLVHMRIGVVLGAKGGVLAKALTPFRAGVGGPLGNGKQMFSWVALKDIVGAMDFCLAHNSLAGPVNFVAPHAVDNATFTAELGRVLRRPTLVRTPAFALKLALGEMANETALANCHVYPQRLLDAGYEFEYPQVAPLLEDILRGRSCAVSAS